MSEIRPGFDAFDAFDAGNVGSFRQGSAGSQFALSRYLVGRAVAESLSRGLMIFALALLVVAGLAEWGGATFWTVVVVILAVGVLLLRTMLLAVLRRLPLTASQLPGQASTDARLRRLVADTRKDVLRELRRLGLPGRTWTLPLLATRLVGKRRAATTEKLRGFEIERVVPPARLDEVHLLLQSSGLWTP